MWRGEGIFFVTFAVTGRQRLLGDLVRIMDDGSFAPVSADEPIDPKQLHGHWNREKYGHHIATIRLKPLGFEIAQDLQQCSLRYPNYQICGKQIMDNHLHLIMRVTEDTSNHADQSAEKSGNKQPKSILQWTHRFRIGITNIARKKGIWTEKGLVFEKAFIRTLSHRGQLQHMLAYTHRNPDNALLMRDNPEMYLIRRNRQYAGLSFDCMGKYRLLDYPVRNVVALPRSLSEEQIAQEVQKALRLAASGSVTYCAAMNDGEKAVTKAIRAAGYPLVVMLIEGFPPEGSEAARFYHPSGVYHTACGEGRLLLMAPKPENYDNPQLIALTENELARKAAAKGQHYSSMPHSQMRWRMIAGNMMLTMLAERRSH